VFQGILVARLAADPISAAMHPATLTTAHRPPPAAGMASRVGSGHSSGESDSDMMDLDSSGAWLRSSGFDVASLPPGAGYPPPLTWTAA
jgi:hypothetical protein